MGGSGGGVGRGDGGGGGGDERPFLVRLLNGDPAALARARGQGESEPAERSGRRVARRSFGPTGDAANGPGRPRRTRRLPESLAAFPGLVAIVAGRDLTERYAAALLPFRRVRASCPWRYGARSHAIRRAASVIAASFDG